MKKLSPLPEKGADTPEEMYALVGIALTYWESSEDIILGIFRIICGTFEPVAMESFIRAPRNVRYSMLSAAMERYPHLFEDGEIASVNTALKGLASLASTRNEIAHGHVSQYTMSVGSEVTASGNYLLPSYNEQEFHERNFRFHHTPQSIDVFIKKLREWRGNNMDIQGKLINRLGWLVNFGMSSHSFIQLAQRIARLEVRGYDAVDQMKAMLEHVTRDGAFEQSGRTD